LLIVGRVPSQHQPSQFSCRSSRAAGTRRQGRCCKSQLAMSADVAAVTCCGVGHSAEHGIPGFAGVGISKAPCSGQGTARRLGTARHAPRSLPRTKRTAPPPPPMSPFYAQGLPGRQRMEQRDEKLVDKGKVSPPGAAVVKWMSRLPSAGTSSCRGWTKGKVSPPGGATQCAVCYAGTCVPSLSSRRRTTSTCDQATRGLVGWDGLQMRRLGTVSSGWARFEGRIVGVG